MTGLSRDLLYDQMRRGNLRYVKIGRQPRRLASAIPYAGANMATVSVTRRQG